MIYTTYFANLRNLPDNIIPVSISGKAPDWYNGLEFKTLAPKYEFFKKWKENQDNDYYIKCFDEQVLYGLDANDIVERISRFANLKEGQTFALVCYEKPSDFCHRHLVANWLKQNGYIVEEFQKNMVSLNI